MSLVSRIKQHEGFRGEVYKDHLGYDTVGYGTKMPITEEEAELLLRHRLSIMAEEVDEKLPWLSFKPIEVQDILYEMTYQMGVNGLLGFKNMLSYIEKDDYISASKEGLNSRWASQTPNRANKLMDKLRIV